MADYILFVPAKSSGTVVTRAKPSGQAGNCAPLDNPDNATHARHNCRSRRPIVKTRTHNWAAWRAADLAECEWTWLTVVVIINVQLLLSGGGCYYQWLLVVTLVSSRSRCPSSSPAPPDQPFFSLPVEILFSEILLLVFDFYKIEFQSKKFKSAHGWCHSILNDSKILSVQTLTFKCQRDIWTQKSKHMFSLICKFGILLAWDRVGISGRADESSFCLFYKHQCLDDWFSWQEGEGGAIKMGNKRRERG